MAEGGRGGGTPEEECSVCVAVHVRPLIDIELVDGCQECLKVTPGVPQVTCLNKSFTFDKVYGSCGAEPSDGLFPECVRPLVDGLFRGYNATVFAFGQTGSGKTYTMGSAYTPGGNTSGVIPEVLDLIFDRINSSKDVDCNVRASFVEIHKEEVRDLLLLDSHKQPAIHVREVPGGGVCLAGATEREVLNKDETAALLEQGSLIRATASTGMNTRSSRSHAIFTITLEQRKKLVISNHCEDPGDDMSEESEDSDKENEREDAAVDDYLVAKMHLVDLAGSERAKRTRAEGQRLQEAIDINRGLLALGKVISALVEKQSHIPYRDSKLTRLLQDSLGGNSRTVMIACVSPADVNLEESINTLRYANRARNIKNKPVVNRDPTAAQIAYLRHQLALARGELAAVKKAGGFDNAGKLLTGATDTYLQDALEQAEKDRRHLKEEVEKLRVQLDGAQSDVTAATRRMVGAQSDCVKYKQIIEEIIEYAKARDFDLQPVIANIADDLEEGGVIERSVSQIATLELENKRLRETIESLQSSPVPSTPAGPFSAGSFAPFPDLEDVDEQLQHEALIAAEEERYRLDQQRLGEELSHISRAIEVKEEQYQRVVDSSGQVEMVKAQYEKMLKDLNQDRSKLQKERMELVQKLQNVQAEKVEDRHKLEEKYREQLREKDEKLKGLKKREKELMKIEKLKQKSDDTCQRLQKDVVRMKQQKVQLQRQIDHAQKEYNQRIREREKELKQLKKQGRVAAAKYQRLEAMHTKQQAVLKRKTEEAEASRKRLKEIVSLTNKAQNDARRRAGAQAGAVECQPNLHAPLLKDDKSRREWLEREINMCNRSWDLRRILDGEIAMRTDACRQLHEVEKRLLLLERPEIANSPSQAESHEKLEVFKRKMEETIAMHSSHIADLQQEYEKAKNEEETKQATVDVRRWAGLKNVAEARTLLKSLFKYASDQRSFINELQVDAARFQEDYGNLQMKLEEAEEEKKELWIANARAHAAVVMSVNASPVTNDPRDRQRDADVEGLIDEIQKATRTPLGSPVPHDSEAAYDSSMDTSEMEDSENEDGDRLEDGDEWEADPDYVPRKQLQPGGANRIRDDPLLLEAINQQRLAHGASRVSRVTVKTLEAGLRWLNSKWSKGKKTKDQLVSEYRWLAGLSECTASSSGRDSVLRHGGDAGGRSSLDALFTPKKSGDLGYPTPRARQLMRNAKAAKEKANSLKERLSRRCTSAMEVDGSDMANSSQQDGSPFVDASSFGGLKRQELQSSSFTERSTPLVAGYLPQRSGSRRLLQTTSLPISGP